MVMMLWLVVCSVIHILSSITHVIDLSIEQLFDTDLKIMKQVHFIGTLACDAITRLAFVLEESKENVLD